MNTITLAAGIIDNSEVMERISIPISASAGTDVIVDTLSYTVRLNRAMLYVDGELTDNADLILPYTHYNVALGTTPIVIARLNGQVLANQVLEDAVRITDLYSSVDTSCAQLRATPGRLRTRPVCANNLFGIQLISNGFFLYPNPAHDEVEVQSEQPVEELQVMNAIGMTLLTTTSTKQFNAASFTHGVYLVRARIAGDWVSRMLVINK